MAKAICWFASCIAAGMCASGTVVVAQTSPGSSPTEIQSQKLNGPWSPLQEGEAAGVMQADTSRPADSHEKYLHLDVTKTAGPGQGRAGAICTAPIAVQNGRWYDATFRAIADGRSVGIVFSLEKADGTVLARTTLPEIGRVQRGGDGTDTQTNSQPQEYSVALHARGSDTKAHLTLTPIEPTSVWIDELTIASRTTDR
jgi:hypothetical protein